MFFSVCLFFLSFLHSFLLSFFFVVFTVDQKGWQPNLNVLYVLSHKLILLFHLIFLIPFSLSQHMSSGFPGGIFAWALFWLILHSHFSTPTLLSHLLLSPSLHQTTFCFYITFILFICFCFFLSQPSLNTFPLSIISFPLL